MAVDYLDNVTLVNGERIVKDRFYVYALCHNQVPFYVGVGKDSRWRHHFYYAKNESDCNTFKQRKIKKLTKQSEDIEVRILYSNLSRNVSFSIEKKLIKLHGRRKDGGTLTNLTLGGEGGSGYDWPEEQRKKTGLAARGRNAKYPEGIVKKAKLLFHYRGYSVKDLTGLPEFKNIPENVIRAWLTKGTQSFDYVMPHLNSPSEMREEKRQDCKKCFERGFNLKQTSDILGLPYHIVQEANARFKGGQV